MFVQMISSESQIILLPNLVWQCSIKSQNVMRKTNSFCYLQGQGHSEGWYDQNMTLSTIVFELLIPWQPDLVWWYIIMSQSVMWKKNGLLHSRSRSQWRFKMLMFVQMISSSSKPRNILFPNLVLWCIIMCQLWCKKIDVLFSRSRSLQVLIWPKYDNFYCIFWTADPFCTKRGLIIYYHKPECFMEKLDCCAQGQGHSKISKCQGLFVHMISSESLNLVLQNLV